jgi:hypothetical protein
MPDNGRLSRHYTSQVLSTRADTSRVNGSFVILVRREFVHLGGRRSHPGGTKSCGFMLILQSFAMQPLNWRKVCTPSKIRMWVKPISLMNSSLECSERVGMVLVTLNIVLMMSCDEYPRSLNRQTLHEQREQLGQWYSLTKVLSRHPEQHRPSLPNRT